APADPGPVQLNGNGNGPGGPMGYASVEYLLYRVRNSTFPSAASVIPVGLVSVDTSNQVFGGAAPALSIPTVGFASAAVNSRATFGGNGSSTFGDQSGVRFTLGCWADCDKTWGLEGSAFYFFRGSDNFTAASAVAGNQFILNTGFNQNVFMVQGGVPTLVN